MVGIIYAKHPKNLSLKYKIIGSSCILLALLVLNSGYAIYAIKRIDRELTAIAHQDIKFTNKLTKITIHQLEQSIQFERALHYGSNLQRNDSAQVNFRKTIKTFDSLSALIDADIIEIETITNEALKKSSEKEYNEFKSVNSALNNMPIKLLRH